MKNIFKYLLVALVIGLSSIPLFAQKTFYATEKGTVLEFVNKNNKGKAESYTRQTITEVQGTDINNCTLLFLHEFFDKNKKKEKDIPNVSIPVRIDNGTLQIDLAPLFKQKLQENGKPIEGEMTFTSEALTIPSDLHIGQELDDYTAIIHLSTQGMTGKTILTRNNRKVTTQEDITVEAGTFHCYKIEYDESTVMEMMGMKIDGPKNKSVEWVTREVGPVLTKNYDKKGKLVSSTELISLSK